MDYFVIRLFMLLVILVTLQSYAFKGAYSKIHRLLPMVLTAICVYGFYEVVWAITRADQIFGLLEELLMMQLVYLILHDILAVYRYRLSKKMEITLFSCLICGNAVCFSNFLYPNPVLRAVQYGVLLLLVFSVLILAVFSMLKVKNQNKRESVATGWLYMAFLVSGVAVPVRMARPVIGIPLQCIAIMISCTMILYLLHRGYLVDLTTVIRENIFFNDQMPLLLFDENLAFLDANEAAEQMLQRETKEMKRLHRESWFAENLPVLRDFPGTERRLELDGRIYECTMAPIYGEGQERGYAFRALDITEKQQQVENLTLEKRKAEKTMQVKNHMLAMMSHELRTPLNAILGFSDVLLERNDLRRETRTLVKRIQTSGITMLQKIDDILLCSKLEAGELAMEKAEYDMVSLLLKSCGIAVIPLMDSQIAFSLELNDRMPGSVIGDARWVRTIVQNLVSCAVKRTKKGYVRVSVHTDTLENGFVLFRMIVEDTAGEKLPDHMETFVREHPLLQGESAEDTDFGLSVVNELVKVMGGDIAVSSDGANGSSVELCFKQQYDQGDFYEPCVFDKWNLAKQEDAKKEEAAPAYIYSNAKVLLAEDMEVNQVVFRKLLQPWKMKLDVVEDGVQAVEAVRQKRYQIVFLDRFMPNMDGIAAAAKIREVYKCPVIAITADLSDDLSENCQAYGFDDFVAKPISRAELKRVIEKHVHPAFRGLVTQSEMQETARMDDHIREIYREELQKVCDVLERMYGEDRGLFTTKVHGIKSTSKQVGLLELGERAEIMEMAAKTGNDRFIEEHFQEFIDCCRETLKALE